MSVKPRIRVPIVFETEDQRANRQLERDLVWSAIMFLAIVGLAIATKVTR